MGKTSAKVEHRDYIPWGWIAIPFCRVSFSGEKATEMEKKWSDITHARYVEYNSIYEENLVRIKNLTSRIEEIENSIHKPWYRFWETAEEKSKQKQIATIRHDIEAIELNNVEVGKKRWFNSYEYRSRLENLLQKNGFYLHDTSSSGEECTTHTEIWFKD